MSNTQYSYELQSIQLPLQLIKDIDSSRTSTLQGLQRTTSSQLFKDFKGLHHSSLQSRTSTLQGQQLFKDIDSTTRTTSTLQGLHHSSLQSRTSIHQGHRLFKDIDTTTRTTSLHCNHPNIIMATVQEYDDILRYKTSTSNKYRSGLSENEKRNIRDKASR